jgi:hypothetical protein
MSKLSLGQHVLKKLKQKGAVLPDGKPVGGVNHGTGLSSGREKLQAGEPNRSEPRK